MKTRTYYDSAIGTLLIEEENGAVTEIQYVGQAFRKPGAATGAEARAEPSPVLERTVTELEEFFRGERRTFSVRVNPAGTPFQRRVWEELRRIPCGETRSYGQIAALAGSPKGSRAVGMACNRNPILILIPCHRVVGVDGSLTGFGPGLPMKEKLLALEAGLEREENQQI